MAKEDYLLSKCGRENPFKVPEGYFDQFTDDLMAKLPERTFDEEAPRKVTLWDKVKPVVYLAAMFAGIAAMFAVAEDFMQSGDEADAKTAKWPLPPWRPAAAGRDHIGNHCRTEDRAGRCG